MGTIKDSFLRLPEDIIHHICSYLPPNEQAQTATISTYWLNAWRTNPSRLNFDDAQFNNKITVSDGVVQDQEARFQDYVNNTLAKFKTPRILEFNLSILVVTHLHHHDFLTCVEKWLNFAMQKRVQVFQIILPDVSINFSYTLPPNILKIESLVTLCVTRCKFHDDLLLDRNNTLILCKNLRVLHLESVYNFSTQMFDRLISACPLICDLKIRDHYDELEEIKVFNHSSLKKLYIEEGCGSETKLIEIKSVPNLEILVVKLQFGQCILRFHACPNLRRMSLKNAILKDEFFETLKDKFPNLEFLELRGCSGFKEKSLMACHHGKLKKVRISESWDDDDDDDDDC